MTTHSQASSSKTRRIAHRTTGHRQGPITRLMSPGDLGELVKPFVFLDYFEFSTVGKMGLPVHPHSGIATHTTLLQGSIDYADSTGKAGRLASHSIEWMQAGGGVWHGGGPSGGEALRGFQLWVALPPHLELAPAYSAYVEANAVPSVGGTRLLFGAYRGLSSSIAYQEPVTYLHVQLRDGERWTYQAPASHDVAWLAVASGGLLAGKVSLRRELAVFEEGSAPIEVVAQGDVEFVIASAMKHPFPLVTGYYSVHTNR
ncbi:MAG TPA: pirin family protein, partial [Polyangiaceae bacterium]